MRDHRLKRLSQLTQGLALVGLGIAEQACTKDPAPNGPVNEPHVNAPAPDPSVAPSSTTTSAPSASASAPPSASAPVLEDFPTTNSPPKPPKSPKTNAPNKP